MVAINPQKSPTGIETSKMDRLPAPQSGRSWLLASAILLALVGSGHAQSAIPPTVVLKGHTREVAALAFAPDGKTLASGGFDRTVRLWDPKTGALRSVFLVSKDAVLALAFSPDGKTLATAGEPARQSRRRPLPQHEPATIGLDTLPLTGDPTGTIRFWDIQGAPRAPMAVDGPGIAANDRFLGLSFSPDGKTLAAAGIFGAVALWDREPLHIRAVRRGDHLPFTAAVFTPDGTTLFASGWDGQIRTWDVASGQERPPLLGHTGWITSLAISPDGRTLATGGWDRTVRTWDVASGQTLATLWGHAAPVRTVAFRSDGLTLASAGLDQVVTLWDLTLNVPRAQLRGATGALNAVAFAPDGTTVAAAGEDGAIRLWVVSRPPPAPAPERTDTQK